MSSILDEEAIREAIRAMYLDGERPAPSITAHELRMKESRTRLRVGFKLPAAVAAALILVVVLFMATPLHHPGRLGPSGSTNPAPAGWVTYSAYGIQLSVPKSWAVSFFPGCPVSATEPGLLTIAPSHAGIGCPAAPEHRPVAKVTLDTYSGTVGDVQQEPRTVNGVPVIAVALGDRTSTQWFIPSAHASIIGTGRGARNVLNTLTRATRNAVEVPGMALGSASSGLASVPLTGTLGVKNLNTGKVSAVRVLNGQYRFTGSPGRYTVTGSVDHAQCTSGSVSLISGRYSTVQPIFCGGVQGKHN